MPRSTNLSRTTRQQEISRISQSILDCVEWSFAQYEEFEKVLSRISDYAEELQDLNKS